MYSFQENYFRTKKQQVMMQQSLPAPVPMYAYPIQNHYPHHTQLRYEYAPQIAPYQLTTHQLVPHQHSDMEPECPLDLTTKRIKLEPPTSQDGYKSFYPSPESSPCHSPQDRNPSTTSEEPTSSIGTMSGEELIEPVDVVQRQSPVSSKKEPRPFKSLKDSLVLSKNVVEKLSTSFCTSSLLLSDVEETKKLIEESARKYEEYKTRMLEQLKSTTSNVNLNMRRVQNSDKPRDQDYLEKRRKNNEAAKRSRDARRMKQDEVVIRANFLDEENLMLKFKVEAELKDLERLRQMEMMRNTHTLGVVPLNRYANLSILS